MTALPSFTLSELAQELGVTWVGDGELVITGIGSLAEADVEQLSHYSSSTYRDDLQRSSAGAVILRSEDRDLWPRSALLAANPYLTYARASQLFRVVEPLTAGIHQSAEVDPSAQIDPSAEIQAHVRIGPRSRVAAGVRVRAGAVVGADCVVGQDTELMANSTLDDRVSIGARGIVHSGAVIGAEGFGFTPDEQGQWQAIAQLGGVRIGDDVSIGANTTIDRGALDDTVIGVGVKIDNQCQVGHNCKIGDHTLICGCVGIVGSTTIGRHCVLAGGSGIGGDQPVSLCDQVVVTAMTLISQSISEPGVYSGAVLHAPNREWKRNALRYRHLDQMHRRLRRLERNEPAE
ncbi:MAG: UDP-3-O-(3-hydroxymyristoyl)glucosamine N-acyltransferase [Pseudomonadales bacterium]